LDFSVEMLEDKLQQVERETDFDQVWEKLTAFAQMEESLERLDRNVKTLFNRNENELKP
jgi:hypothetical protein